MVERDELQQLLAEGASLAEGRRRLSLHEATVAYWVQKHGLAAVNAARHQPRGALERVDLETLVASGMSIAEIAQALQRSKGTVRHWLAKYGMRTGGSAGRRARADASEARAAGLSEASLVCPRHGRTLHVVEPRGYYRCCRCRGEAVIRRRRRVKRTLVEELGGRCRLCGYDRCMAALEFHHVDPAAKEFGVASRGACRIDDLRLEVRKCVLLCSNCHAEVESGVSRVPE